MISVIETAAGKGNAPIFQLKVVLLGSKPPVWRRLQIPGDARLDWLHAALQVAIGWTNSHLHQFQAGEDCYSDTRHSDEFGGVPETLDERKFTLGQIAPREQDSFGYEYDFGDSWEHEIVVEKILPPEAGTLTAALCLDGARACPPENCGGVWGYDNLLKILKNRKHPEHTSMKEWLGRAFDAESFDVGKTNLWLRKLKWPRVTEAQLRKVLMGRDNYHE
jgi:hypothetical protein